MPGCRLAPGCPVMPVAAGSPEPLLDWVEAGSRKISQILKRSWDKKSLSHPVLITGWASSLPVGPTRVPGSGTMPVPIP